MYSLVSHHNHPHSYSLSIFITLKIITFSSWTTQMIVNILLIRTLMLNVYCVKDADRKALLRYGKAIRKYGQIREVFGSWAMSWKRSMETCSLAFSLLLPSLCLSGSVPPHATFVITQPHQRLTTVRPLNHGFELAKV